MTRGICYFLCGNWRQYLGPLVVSLHSLRRHWDGPVCLLVSRDIAAALSLTPAFDWFIENDLTLLPMRFSIEYVDLAPVRRHAAYVTKASLWRHSPFDRTLLLDCDTVVTGGISELFEAKLTVTRFANWITTGKIVGGRLRQWAARGLYEDRVKALTATPHPAINTGVVAWDRQAARLELGTWEKLTQYGWQCSFTDELAMQILWPDFEVLGCRMLDDSYNCSAIFGVNRDDARVWHYHGRRMVRRTEAGALYRPHLLTALEANAGGIRDWLQEVDPPLWNLAQ